MAQRNGNQCLIQQFFLSPFAASLVTKCVHIDVKQHNTTSSAQTSCLNMEIHTTDCCTIKCSATAWWIILSLFYVYAAAIHGENRKQVIFIVYIWRLQVYHVCINLLLQQRDANAEESTARGIASLGRPGKKKNMSLTWPLNH